MAKPNEDEIRAITDWIVNRSLGEFDLSELLGEVCQMAVDVGVPIARAQVGFATLHPMFRARTMLWTPEGGSATSDIGHEYEYTSDWQNNPVRPLVEGHQGEVRYAIETPGDWEKFPLLVDLRAGGITDYFGIRIRFRELTED